LPMCRNSLQRWSRRHGKQHPAREKKLLGIRVRYPDGYRFDLEKIEGIRLMTPAGSSNPVGSVAALEKTGGQAEIHREGLRQFVGRPARIKDRDLGRTSTTSKRTGDGLTVPADVDVVYGGCTRPAGFIQRASVCHAGGRGARLHRAPF